MTSVSRKMWLREGEDGGGGGVDKGGGASEDKAGGAPEGKGNPAPKPWTPPANENEYNQIIEERLKRERSKLPSNWEEIVEKASQWDVLDRESKPERERELQQAREQAAAEERARVVPVAVRQAFRAEAKGVLTADQVASLLEDLDLSKYVGDDGTPNEDKIAKKVKAFAPADGGPGRNGANGYGPGFGQGSGHGKSKGTLGESGKLEAQRRFPERAAQKS